MEPAATPDLPTHGNQIVIRGARTHNLRNIDLEIPHDRLIVVTGPSGCGKSSLAIDTIFAEGQRQYIETLSIYARQFVNQLPRADLDSIEGLVPTLRVDQHGAVSGRRSTVGTVTGIHDFLRLMFARLGTMHCHQCGQPVRQQSAEKIVEWILQLAEGTRVMLLAPLVRARKGKHSEVFERIRRERLVRCRVDGQILDIDSLPELNARKVHTVEAVSDRIVVRSGGEARTAESLALALNLSGGIVNVAWQSRDDGDHWQERLFSTQHACPDCGISYPPVEPQIFSFNSPQGACPICEGLGSFEQFDSKLVFSHPERTLAGGAAAFWSELTSPQRKKWLADVAPLVKLAKISPEQPLQAWTASQRETFWRGTGDGSGGMNLILEKMTATATRAGLLSCLESLQVNSGCAACHGTRLRPESLAITIADTNIGQVAAMPVAAAARWLDGFQPEAELKEIAEPVARQLSGRLRFLLDAGLGYLTIDRPAESLSGGEFQRVRLAAAIGNDLTNCCFVLDEPSIGLHPRDNDRLIGTIRGLRDAGNTLIVVEHDPAIMEAADWLIDLGPGAGKNGGRICAAGTPDQIRSSSDSVTGRFLSGREKIPFPQQRRVAPLQPGDWITIENASGHNLKNVTTSFPAGLFSVVTGVSGSGKSTLVRDTLVPALLRRLGNVAPEPAPHDKISGGESLTRIVPVDQKPLGKNIRGCPATFSGVMDELRKLFAQTRQAKRLGFGPAHFSFNSSTGWCTECQGHGRRRISMNFLPDIFVTCESCHGARYNPQSLLCQFRGASIGDVLQMDIADAARHFSEIARIHRILLSMVEVGLGYLSLGQPTSTLSGGECQRLKLATELSMDATAATLYVLDEPTTGLHFEDVRRLIAVLQQLTSQGNTLIVIEHHLDVIRNGDWVIDLGPDGGENGGQVLAAGTPEQVAATPESVTGHWLKPLLNETQS